MSSAENNVSNLWRISKGMSQAQVICIMRRPFDYETFEFDGEIYDVWFYITRPTGLGQSRLVPQNLTPLTFKNGVLVDVGYVYYNYLVKEEEIRAKMAATAQPAPEPDKREDIELENILETPSNAQKKQPQKQSSSKKTAPSPPSQPAPTSTPTPKSPATTPPKTPTPSNQKTPQPPKGQDQGQGYVPKNQLPGRTPNQAPNQQQVPPNSAPSKTSKNNLSMCSRPKQSESAAPESNQDSDSSSDEEWDEDDQRMLEDESEQNFDFW